MIHRFKSPISDSEALQKKMITTFFCRSKKSSWKCVYNIYGEYKNCPLQNSNLKWIYCQHSLRNFFNYDFLQHLRPSNDPQGMENVHAMSAGKPGALRHVVFAMYLALYNSGILSKVLRFSPSKSLQQQIQYSGMYSVWLGYSYILSSCKRRG